MRCGEEGVKKSYQPEQSQMVKRELVLGEVEVVQLLIRDVNVRTTSGRKLEAGRKDSSLLFPSQLEDVDVGVNDGAMKWSRRHGRNRWK